MFEKHLLLWLQGGAVLALQPFGLFAFLRRFFPAATKSFGFSWSLWWVLGMEPSGLFLPSNLSMVSRD